jgi:tungstate transport system substrate-binding protein
MRPSRFTTLLLGVLTSGVLTLGVSTLGALALVCSLSTMTSAEERFIVLASTTSTDNSGLFYHILPPFEKETGIAVRVVARGTGQALGLGRDGDADLLLVHDRSAELRFVAEGYGVMRREVMYNDFVIVGPRSDPARIKGMDDVVEALTKIAAVRALFASRGDDSGTHRAELRFWDEAAIDVDAVSGSWYLETGAGMGATLNVAAGKPAYTMSDRGTWLSFENRGTLELMVEGDPRLFNPYGVMLISPERHPHVKAEDGLAFIEWITSEAGQAAIASFKINGERLFFPNAAPAE